MLILARRMNERIIIGDDIEVAVLDIKGDQVKIGIRAPENVKVYRQEVFEAIQEENRRAALTSNRRLPSLEQYLKSNISGKPNTSDTDASPHATDEEGGAADRDT